MLIRVCVAGAMMVGVPVHAQCEETAKLVRPDATNSDDFALSVAIGPHGISVGAPGVPEGGTVECYRQVEGVWTHVQTIEAPGNEVKFGGSMDMSGDVLVIGDPFVNSSIGAAHVYRFDGSWVFEQTLEADEPEFGDQFGVDVAIDGDRVVVGAFGDGEYGNAYVFEFDGATWSKVQVLEPSTPSALSTFGERVDIAGDVVAVTDKRNNEDAGAVYAFRKVGDTYVEQGKLIASTAADFDKAGVGLSTDGQRIVFGAIHSDVAEFQAGAAFVFVWNGASWVEEQTLVAGDADPIDQYGDDVHVQGDRILVGALDSENGFSAGAVYIYEPSGGSWSQTQKLLGSDADAVSFFGTSIGASGSQVVIGAYAKEAAYAFQCGSDQDTDGDGLLDSWETDGLDVNGDGIIDLDLPAMGADPMYKDLFVEVDVMENVPLISGAIEDVEFAFGTAPVNNPDGFAGIELHIDLQTADTFPFEQTWDGDFIAFGAIKSVFFGTQEERDDPNWEHIREARKKVFRYCTIVNSFDGNAVGWGEMPGNDFMCAHGGLLATDRRLQASTFMHELGHNLGLHHGGSYMTGDVLEFDSVNNKPNYVSCMNYAFDFYTDEDGDPLDLDYSREAMLPLIEDNLDETIGIVSQETPHALTFFGWREPGEQPQIAWVQLNVTGFDWNQDGDQQVGVTVDLNWLGDGYPDGQDPSPGQTLHGRNDWQVIQLPLGDSGNFADGQHVVPGFDELTEDDIVYVRENLPPPPICLADVNDDGVLNILDFVAFQDLFVQQDPAADCDGDGLFNILDFVCFQTLFQIGCP